MEPTNEPYLVFTKNRPHRIAFILDVSKRSSFDDLIRLIRDCQKKWGGKFFQIIPASNGTVTGNWITYLAEYDPDLIHSFTKLSKQTIKKITRACNPYAFMFEGRTISVPNHPDDPIDVLPDSFNTARLWRNPINAPEILAFDIGEFSIEAPKYISNFVEANFGTLSNDLANSNAIRSSGASIKNLPSRTRSQFLSSMKVLDEWNRRIYPTEYSMLPGINYEVSRNLSNDMTTLFIGDKVTDLIYYWNEALQLPEWLSTTKCHAWISTKFVEDPKLRDVIRGWLSKFSRQRDGSSVKELKIVSSSVNLTTLRRYATLLTDGLYISTSVEKISKPKSLKYSEHIATSTDMESFSVSGDSFSINAPEPNVQQGVMGGQKWMTDVLIERKDHNEYRRPLKQFWLQFPQDNNLALLVTGRSISARINRDGILSIPLSRDKDVLRLSLEIPDNSSIAQSILLGERNSIHYNGDLRKGVEKRPFTDVTNSSAGRSLRGAIHLFGGLAGAAQFFESSFWRDTFMTLAGSNPLGDIIQAKDLRNKVEKNLKKVSQPVQPKAVDAWVKTVTDQASKMRAMSEVKPYQFFTERLKKEIDESKKAGDVDKFDEVERRLLSRLNWLIQSGILSLGLMNRCAHCGLKAWYSIEELKSDNNCRGCGYEFSIHAEQKWWYRLNSLISSDGGIYNQIPLILALGELYERSRYSFYYYPPVDVYSGASRGPLTDLDIFAIVDGKLAIGEVKNTQQLFEDGDFEKIEKAAIRLRPAIVYLSSLDEKPTRITITKIEALRNRLKSYGIDVQWLEMNPIFDKHGLWGI